jgi:SAM-dependent methyltransferase
MAESTQLPDHVIRNRSNWGKQADWYREPGRESWQIDEPRWGIWELPDSEIGALGDMSRFAGKDVIELGCGTAYFGAWFAKAGANVTGIDITPEQLASAHTFQDEFDVHFPLIEGSAEAVPLPDNSFDVAFSEYGASLWCNPRAWLSEAARLLRPGGELFFMTNHPLMMMCMPQEGMVGNELLRAYFEIDTFEWPGEEGVEFQMPHGARIDLLRELGFSIERLIEIQAPADTTTRYEWASAEWAHQWPSEEIWLARLEG